MPRGVKGSGPKKAGAQSTAKARAKATTQPQDAPKAPAVFASAPVTRYGQVNVDLLNGDDLRLYARKVGVLPRDCDNLTEDRLRQNVRIVEANHLESILEG